MDIGALIWPLQQLLVTPTTVQVVVGTDINDTTTQYIPDADIAGLSQAASTNTISMTRAAINSAGPWDTPPRLWKVQTNDCGPLTSLDSYWYASCDNPNYNFVSNIVNSVNTGVVKNYSFQFNSLSAAPMLRKVTTPDHVQVSQHLQYCPKVRMMKNRYSKYVPPETCTRSLGTLRGTARRLRKRCIVILIGLQPPLFQTIPLVLVSLSGVRPKLQLDTSRYQIMPTRTSGHCWNNSI